jgi:hypothetical protein
MEADSWGLGRVAQELNTAEAVTEAISEAIRRGRNMAAPVCC